ncbi:phasin family protein [Microvirga sp. 3-52]|uniref:phasin family protein n=1 Tax=Microvirga sp. 3-52 TaxID=2792425 RepID=UPI001AC0EB47|nr:phasin family protein [Microvirga sp. 3-52]MBO1904865.1 phasin family protein [Microvirga sp. 3-52]MBS7452343.1 phasin family protein [Microvirga sp. 3-52]
MNTRKFNQTPPDKARDLFEKLLATSDTAVKTRERLFADLQEELKLLAALQEQHLLPVLQRHGMVDLVRQALNDNEETATLLTDLESMPKNNGEFLTKVAELRRVFQQHIRDDRKELLPAVLKVLSDDEAEAVIERVEDEMAAIDETKRSEARRAREQVDAVQRVADDLGETVRAGTESAQNIAQSMQQVVQNSFGVFSELARRSTGQALQMFARPDGDSRGLTQQASESLKTVAQSNTVLMRGLQDVSREWFELSQKRLQTNLEGLNALARCRSMNDLVEVQSSLIRDNLEQTVDNSRRLAELTIQLADEASRTATVEVKQFAERVSRAA